MAWDSTVKTAIQDFLYPNNNANKESLLDEERVDMVSQRLHVADDNIALASCNTIKRICKPLADVFGINYFAYAKLYWNNTHVILSSRHDWARYYTHNHLYLYTEGFPNILGKKFISSREVSPDTPYGKKVLRVMDEKFDIGQLIFVMKHHVGYSECIVYGVSSNAEPLESIFYPNLEYFNKFLRYFKSEARDILKKADSSKLTLPQEIYLNTIKKSLLFIKPIDTTKFDQAIKNKRVYLQNQGNEFYLTMRELEMVCLLIQGLSYQQIANSMEISVHTVHYYIKMIRDKLGINRKSEMIKYLRECDYFKEIENDTSNLDAQFAQTFDDFMLENFDFDIKLNFNNVIKARGY